jgi:hypothetical protein
MRRQFGLYLLTLSIVLPGMFASIPGSRVKADGDQHGRIVGGWINTVTVNTPPGVPPLVISELFTINPSGTFIDTIADAHSSQNPFYTGPFAPLAVDLSDAIGTWKPTSDSNQFVFTFKRFLFAGANTPTAVYGSFFPGQNVGVATIEAVGSLQTSASGLTTLTGPFTFQLTNSAGHVVLAASGTFSARRLEIEPLATP